MSKYEEVLNDLVEEGVHIYGNILDPHGAGTLFKALKACRNWGQEMFMSREEYLKNPQHEKINPGDGFNLMEDFQEHLDFVEKNDELQGSIKKLLGDKYKVVLKKVICGVPHSWMPAWVAKEIESDAVKNLNAYMRPEYRDVAFFHGIDFHQDMIDWPRSKKWVVSKNLLTMYVYIHDVDEHDSPLYVLPRSHKFGATVFPHELKILDESKGEWQYKDQEGRSMQLKQSMLTGQAGYVAIWHNCTLHGTMPIQMKKDTRDRMRISLRYLIARADDADSVDIDLINERIEGPLSLDVTRRDVDEKGKPILKENHINKLIK